MFNGIVDSTAQYIHGGVGVADSHGVYVDGLRCAQILIGAYDMKSGTPVAGVMNQPFSVYDKITYRYMC